MNYLLLDTSNKPMSVAVMQDGKILAEQTTNLKQNHSVQLMPAILTIIKEAGVTPKDLDAIVVANGPGSYTGLRIGVTTAKTLAYALNTKLYGVSSLAALANTVEEDTSHQYIVPVMDARREAVYAGVYQYQNHQLVNVLQDQYITIEALNQYLLDLNASYVFVGNELDKITDLLNGKVLESLPKASRMLSLIKEPQAIHTFKPNYLKLSEAEQNWLKTQQG